MVKHDVSRKELKEDAFRDSMFWMIQWAFNHRKWIISAVVVLLAGGGSVVGFTLYRQAQVRDEAVAFHQVEDRVRQIKEEKARNLEGRKAYQAFLETYPQGLLAPEALLTLARLSYEDNKLEDAVGYFERVLAHPSTSTEIRNMARLGLGTLAEVRGDLEKAAEYTRALPEEVYPALKYFLLGRLALAKKDTKEARKNFDEAAKVLPPTILTEWAKQALDFLP